MELFFILLGVPVIVGIFVVLIYNGIVSRKNSVERAWANVIVQELQKGKIISQLEDLVKDYKEFESDIQQKITQFRSSSNKLNPKDLNVDSLKKAEEDTASLVAGFNLVAEAYPDLKTAELFLNLMDEISNQQDNVAASIRIFNSNVETFNSGIQVFPSNLINGSLNKEKEINTFSDSSSESNFDYTPNFKS